jgi:hypothetical protein
MGCKYQQLSKGDRIKIHTLLFCNKTQKEIAQELKVHPSAVSLLTTDHEKPLKFNTPNKFFSLILCLIKKLHLVIESA